VPPENRLRFGKGRCATELYCTSGGGGPPNGRVIEELFLSGRDSNLYRFETNSNRR
jgi:hypothetical protein